MSRRSSSISRPFRRWALGFAAFAASVVAQPAPIQLPFNNSQSHGPDGPWHYISLSVGQPAQMVDFYPVLGPMASVLQPKTACGNGAPCLSPAPGMYDTTIGTGARQDLGFNDTWQDISTWPDFVANGNTAYTGGGKTWMEQINEPQQSSNIAFYLASNVTTHTSSGPSYVPLSLLSLENKAVPQPKVQAGDLLDRANWEQGYLTHYVNANAGASSSFGMHIGSPTLGQNASLFFGGYDQSRLIEQPASFALSDKYPLNSISVNTAEGFSPFDPNLDQGIKTPPTDLLSSPLQVTFDPSTPYMSLPASVCSGMAQFLPVTFDPTLGLYLWNTSAPAYKNIIKSPTFLNFTLGDAKNTSIRVPFALLNLTLSAPLVREPTPYFPCSPVQGDTAVTLGRAFLQAAFFAQDDAGKKLIVGQAPGPDDQSSKIVTLTAGGAFAPAPDARAWLSTWSQTFTALTATDATTGNGGSSTSTSSTTANSSLPSSSSNYPWPLNHLSGGAIIGIAGGAATVALGFVIFVLWIMHRRNSRRNMSIASANDYPGDNHWHSEKEFHASEKSFGEVGLVEVDLASPRKAVLDGRDQSRVTVAEQVSMWSLNAQRVAVVQRGVALSPAPSPPDKSRSTSCNATQGSSVSRKPSLAASLSTSIANSLAAARQIVIAPMPTRIWPAGAARHQRPALDPFPTETSSDKSFESAMLTAVPRSTAASATTSASIPTSAPTPPISAPSPAQSWQPSSVSSMSNANSSSMSSNSGSSSDGSDTIECVVSPMSSRHSIAPFDFAISPVLPPLPLTIVPRNLAAITNAAQSKAESEPVSPTTPFSSVAPDPYRSNSQKFRSIHWV